MLQRPKICHLKALNKDKIDLEVQIHSTIRDSSGALFLKSVLFRKKGRGKSLILPRPCSSRLLSTTLAKKLLIWAFVPFVVFE